METFDISHALVTLGGLLITVAVVKTDLNWIKNWMKEHKEEHRAKDLDFSQRLRKLELGE